MIPGMMMRMTIGKRIIEKMQHCSESHRKRIVLYVTGCLEEAGVIFSGTALDKPGKIVPQLGIKIDTSPHKLDEGSGSDFCPIRAEVNPHLFPTWAQAIFIV